MTQQRILISGVSRGLGHELARLLSEQDNEVWGSSRDGTTDLDLAGCLAIDLSDEDGIIAAAERLSNEVDSLDVILNCAGTDSLTFGADEGERGPFDLDAETFNSVFAVNVTGPMLVTRHMLPLLRRGTDPIVLNISSQLGSMQVAANTGKDAAYSVSKAALNMLSVRSAATLQPDGIGVVMLHPGWVQTDMGGENAAMTTEESAQAIVDTLASLTLADTGKFLRWDGTEHPW